MKLLNAMFSALAMYSRIPVPKVGWKDENRRYALCFFPLVGVFIGAALLIWQWLCQKLSIGSTLFAAVATYLPILITGGIHMDGFYDVTDARSSCLPVERKLEIMSDPHTGAFAGMKGCLYFLLMFGLYTEVRTSEAAQCIAAGFVLSRTLSALAVITFKAAKKEGALQDFKKPAEKRGTLWVLVSLLMILEGMLLMMDAGCGILIAVISLTLFLYYKKTAYTEFGGITGDLAGWFVQLYEMGILAGVVIFFKCLF